MDESPDVAEEVKEEVEEITPRRLGFFRPETKMTWLPYKPLVVGVSCFCYGVPFFWGAWPLYPLQVVCSFMSDYVMTGRDSYWHPLDRTLATFNTVYVIVNAFWVVPWWHVLLLAVATLSNYAASLHFIKKRHVRGYVVAHTLWHVTGGASISYLMASACGPSIVSDCDSKRVAGLYCGCPFSW